MLMRMFRMEANRRTVAYVIAPDHVQACQSYLAAARANPARYPQDVELFPVAKWEQTLALPASIPQGLIEAQP